MAHPLFVLNGSNLNMLGKREPHLYGTTTLAEVRARTEALASELGLDCDFRQTNHEGVLVDWIQEAFEKDAAVVINPAGFSFHSIALLDALKMFDGPKVEVHITNIHKREPMYQKSLMSHGVTGVIAGLGGLGYALAVDAIAAMAKS